MYLKEIKANGFKSFADKITISLDGKITCIVGPNGSGKSNIVDAVRWVLGEQSVKTLRGEGGMSDVIFQGSKSRSSLNTAYVELVFQNEDHYLKIPYTEVSIKRKVYRTGENEYFLNNEHCRLKDILDLFLDSGVGRSSFSMIGQGEIQKILSNQSEDRRQIFEEASGILKYKKRKNEALKKLDKTHNSMERLEDILGELERQIDPLKRQSEAARNYQDAKNALEQNEIALLAYDLTNYQKETEQKEKEKKEVEDELANLEVESLKEESTVSKEKTIQLQLEKELAFFQNELLKTTEKLTRLQGNLNLFQSSDLASLEEERIKEKARIELENIQELEKEIKLLQTELSLLKEQQETYCEEEKIKQNEFNTVKQTYNKKEVELNRIERNLVQQQYQLEALKRELEQGGILPEAVRCILSTPNLRGICDTIGNLVTLDVKYLKAFDVAAASSKNFIVVETEEAGKEAIAYLKHHNKGRATFFPISVIEKRFIEKSMLDKLRKESVFLGTLSDFIVCDKKYRNIIENQFGMVLVAKDLENAISLSKKSGHHYKVVSLDGDVIHAGGSMSGGSSFKSKSILSMRQEVKDLEKSLEANKNTKERLSKELLEIKERLQQIEEKSRKITFEKEKRLQLYLTKEKELENRKKAQLTKQTSLKNYQSHLDGTLKKEEQELLQQCSLESTYQEELQLKIAKTKEEISLSQDRVLEKEANEKVNHQIQKEKEKRVQQLELDLHQISLKMDLLLETLRDEYSLTYEKAKKEYSLKEEEQEARKKVLYYKEIIKKIGMVNLESIEEYEKVRSRYEFLLQQKEDLTKAEATLLEIMREMDQVMQEEFLKTFETIRIEFQKVFKELFHGGTADLVLTDREHILTTGIDIIASPPGKKLSTITLLSGGEKTLTAISLLFAILNVRVVPFCLFDEVEAALDEANVEQFGKYLEHYKNKTQFLIITHKKKTMEYADTLYGITMQESGVSKLVSVKLENQVEKI